MNVIVPEPLGFTSVRRADPIRQGDVLEFIHRVAPWRVFAVVVTADCDLAHSKHAGFLSYVPVLPAEVYLSEFEVEKRLRKIVEKAVAEPLRPFLQASLERENPDYRLPPLHEVFDNLVNHSVPELASLLGVLEPKAQRLAEAIGLWRRAHAAGMNLRQKLALIEEIRAYQSPKNSPDEWRDLRAHLVKLPGDAMFVPGGFPTLGPDSPCGYVIYLRRILETTDTAIAPALQDRHAPGVELVRVARLAPTQVHHLTQKLGYVFSSIGLPSDYEECLRRTAEELKP